MSMAEFGITDHFSTLRQAFLREPANEIPASADWRSWGYARARSPEKALAQHQAFVQVLTAAGVTVHLLPPSGAEEIDGCYACDPMLTTPWGVIANRMGKPPRRAETIALVDYASQKGIPTLGCIEAPGCVEGGDVLWLRPDWLAVGVGFRTNHAGVDQLRDLLGPFGVRVRAVELPWDQGPGACLHLRSLVNPVDENLAVIHRTQLPVAFVQEMVEAGYDFVDAVPSELENQGNNLLAVGPRNVILVGGNPLTEARLTEAGVVVQVVSGDELCVLGTGGPTCLVQEVSRGETREGERLNHV
jgi:N-dimethylarginine dimethylaminohydrolase